MESYKCIVLLNKWVNWVDMRSEKMSLPQICTSWEKGPES